MNYLQCSLPLPFAHQWTRPQDLLHLPGRSGLRRPPRQCLSFPFAALCVMAWTVLPSATNVSSLTSMLAAHTATVVVRRRMAEVSNWEAMKTACGSSGMVALSNGFVMGTSTSEIDFSGKQLVIIGNSKTLDAGENG